MKKLMIWGMPLLAMGLLAACSSAPASSSTPAASSPAASSAPAQSSAASSAPAASTFEATSEESEATTEESTESAPVLTSSEDSTPAPELTAVYLKTAEWWAADGARSGIYLWNGGNTNASWPGEAMESLGDGLWKYTFNDEDDYTNLIFTRIGTDSLADWGAKSVDIVIADIDAATPVFDISASGVTWGDPGVSGTWTALAA